MRRNAIETVMGAVVLIVAGLFLFFSYTSSGVRAIDGYTVTAKFDRVDGLAVGGDVRLSGIRVGTVTEQTLDPETYLAVVRMSIDPAVRLPKDSSAEIVSAGLLGERYLALVPGGAEEMIPDGGTILYTQSPVSLENLIGQLIFSNQSNRTDGQTGGNPGPQ